MASNFGCSWNQFVEDNLLCSKLFDGIYLFSVTAEIVYSSGPIITEEECQQFVGIFHVLSEKQELDIYQHGFYLGIRNDQKVHYKVYKKSYCSMYCISDNRQAGLVVCNLPYGMLLTTYSQPVQPQDAINLVERTCALLRG